ncbi:DUF4097 family beta strand repeat protein [bacterium]|nr:DUF4097 family beta strand repeat protein [bacterium]
MKTNRLTKWIPAIVMLLWMSAHAQEIIDKENHWQWKSEKDFTVKSGGLLKMTEIHGDVTIHSWHESRVGIKSIHEIHVFTQAEAEAVKKKHLMTYKHVSNTVLIEGIKLDNQAIHSNYEIYVPKQFQCDIEISGGDLEIEEIDGKIDAHIGGGDVSIAHVLGPTDLHVGGGDIEIEGCKKDINIHLGGGDLEIENADGPIEIKMGGGDADIEECAGPVILELGGGDLEIDQVQKDIQLKVGGGDIEISNIQGNAQCEVGGGCIEITDVSGSLSAKTGGGDIEVTLTDAVTFKSPMLLESSTGDIDLTLPSSIKATVHVEIQKRYGYSEEQIYSDFPLKMSLKEEDTDTKIRATGMIQGGGPSIDLKTCGGDISIQKKETE